jgi:hypothetical protein
MTKRNVNILDRIGSLIPGYKGYSLRDEQRNTDKKVRNHIANQLAIIEINIKEFQLKFIKSDKLLEATEIESARKAINTLLPKIKHAPYGVSGFFATQQLKEDELEQIYSFDAEIAERVSNMLTLSHKLEQEPLASISLVQHCRSIDEILIKRTDFVKRFK